MAKKWFVQPETVRLDLGDGDWLLVKKRLTVGEQRKSLASAFSEFRTDGRVTANLEMLGKREALAYLVDWSLCDDAGKPVRIDTDAKRVAAIDNLSPEAFDIISAAVAAHVEAMDAEREAEKNAPRQGSESSATLSSVAG